MNVQSAKTIYTACITFCHFPPQRPKLMNQDDECATYINNPFIYLFLIRFLFLQYKTFLTCCGQRDGHQCLIIWTYRYHHCQQTSFSFLLIKLYLFCTEVLTFGHVIFMSRHLHSENSEYYYVTMTMRHTHGSNKQIVRNSVSAEINTEGYYRN